MVPLNIGNGTMHIIHVHACVFWWVYGLLEWLYPHIFYALLCFLIGFSNGHQISVYDGIFSPVNQSAISRLTFNLYSFTKILYMRFHSLAQAIKIFSAESSRDTQEEKVYDFSNESAIKSLSPINEKRREDGVSGKKRQLPLLVSWFFSWRYVYDCSLLFSFLHVLACFSWIMMKLNYKENVQ